MASNFLDLEANVHDSSDDDQTYDDEQDFIDDSPPVEPSQNLRLLRSTPLFLPEGVDRAELSKQSKEWPLLPDTSHSRLSEDFVDSLAAKYAHNRSKEPPSKRFCPIPTESSKQSHPILPLVNRSFYNPSLVTPLRAVTSSENGGENRLESSSANGPLLVATARQQAEVMDNWGSWAQGATIPTPVEGYERHQFYPGQWVKITKGRYKDDDAQIWKPSVTRRTVQVAQNGTGISEREEVQEGYWVFVVPRLPDPSQTQNSSLRLKRKASAPRQRLPRRLFEKRDYGVSVQWNQEVQGYKVNGRAFSHGLEVRFYIRHSLEPLHVVSTSTGKFFQDHPFSKRFPVPTPELWKFEPGDVVTVQGYNAAQTGRGTLTVVENRYLVDFGEPGTHAVPVKSIKKVVEPGDHVIVLVGHHEGKIGLVAERQDCTLGISERASRNGIDFFVHINSVRRESANPNPFMADIPWHNFEVDIFRGPNAAQVGVVKDVKRSKNGFSLVLSLYIPALTRSVEVFDHNVFVKGTRQHLFDLYPLHKAHNHLHIDRQKYYRMQTGRVPWVGERVVIVAGVHKGKTAIVRDVNRVKRPKALSELELDVELEVFGSAMQKIYYDYVREWETGLPLAEYFVPQDFYLPSSRFVGSRIRWQPSLFVPVGDDGTVDWPSVAKEAETIKLPYDIWNPYYGDYWNYTDFASSPQRAGTPEAPLVEPPTEEERRLEEEVRESAEHWMGHPRLLGVSICVDILEGGHQKLGVFVRSTRLPSGHWRGRFKKGTTVHDVPLSFIGKSSKKLKIDEDRLLVIVEGDEDHLGKLVRRVTHFHCGKDSYKTRWYVMAVIVGTGRSASLTGELLELQPERLQFVEETPSDSWWASKHLMAAARQAACSGSYAQRRNPGEADYTPVATIIRPSNTNTSSSIPDTM
ncbi:hypothetical protein V5O48_013196 [Marasmius crinis-equi]|uniref:KOW domain-containing protein n=1 Tax=Marasmius crinis-equi TaxID=585013 RepID=A0ABR3F0P9_9AGAR